MGGDDLAFHQHIFDDPNNHHQYAATHARSQHVSQDAAAGRAGAAAKQTAKNLTADTTTQNTCHGITSYAQTNCFDQGANDIATGGAADETNDERDDIQIFLLD